MRPYGELQYAPNDTNRSTLGLYLAKVMAIPDFFKEFLSIFIQEISKIPNFEYEVIWRTPICTK
jgi:hypothetical protein